MYGHKRFLVSKALTLILLALFIFTIVGCTAKKDTEKITLKLYFLQKQNGKLVPEERQVEVSENAVLAEVAIRELLRGPEDENLKSIIPENAKLLNIEVEDKLAKVDFSKEIDDFTDIETKKLAVISIINTLTELPGIEKVSIMSEGKELLSSDNKPYGPLAREDLDKLEKEKPKLETEITIYFSDNEAMYLVPETRKVELENKLVEEAIVEELIKGPEKDDHFNTIPEETKLLSVKVEDNTVYVDFSKEFKENHTGGSTGEIMTIYSVVNSLTELESIDKVVFLIEGQKEKTLSGHLIFDEPFYRDEALIEK